VRSAVTPSISYTTGKRRATMSNARPLNYKKRKLLRVLRRHESPPSTSALAGHIDARAPACRRQLLELVADGRVVRIDQPGLGGDRWRLREGGE